MAMRLTVQLWAESEAGATRIPAGHGRVIRPGRRAKRLEPAADVNLRVSFSAEMQRAGDTGRVRFPALDR